MISLMIYLQQLTERLTVKKEDGFTTAELLGNAALAVAALGVIWIGMQKLGVNVMDSIQKQIVK